ncbi:MAG: hypothetical protein Q9222_007726 [Ikaeria aurantiellina]
MPAMTRNSAFKIEKTQRPSSFMSFPPEIRRQVYEELLVPDSNGKPHLLYYDRRGKNNDLPIYPSILLVNKQINAEATDLLYERNHFLLNLTTPVRTSYDRRVGYEDRMGSCQALIRVDSDGERLNEFAYPGLMDARSIQRLAHIEIAIAVQAVWSWGTDDFFTHIGRLWQQLLLVLAEEPEAGGNERRKKSLRITVKKQQPRDMALFPKGWSAERRSFRIWGRMKKEEQEAMHSAHLIFPLIKKISEKRDVSISEVVTATTYSFPPGYMTLQGAPGIKTERTRCVPIGEFRNL